jgi:mRNA interferase RelE/StbE
LGRYRAVLLDSVKKYLRDQSKEVRQRIGEAINAIEVDPRPNGVKALQGNEKGRLRYRVGDYRVVYECKDQELLILVVKVGDRKEIYR